jgi:hypothetical protein
MRENTMRPSGTSTTPACTTRSAPWPVSAAPSKAIRPAAGGAGPAIVFISVVFPAPLTPTSATSSPGSTRSATSRRMVIWP